MNQHYAAETTNARHSSPRTRRRPKNTAEDELRRAAANPAVETDKFREMLQYEERQQARRARIQFDTAFSQLQRDMPAIIERGTLPLSKNGQVTSYALWEDINETVKPLLTKFGFAMRFRTGQAADRVSATCYLSHTGGHCEETTISLPLDMRDGKSSVHAIGSSTSYAKRYAACALLNITSLGEDDDGDLAGDPPCIDPEQLAELRMKMSSVGGVEEHLAALLGVHSLAKLPISRFRHAMATVTAKGARK